MEWRLTATTLFCPQARKWVPILVYRDGKTGCGFYTKQAKRFSNGRLPCSGPGDCAICTGYREDVFRREVEETEW